MTPSEVLVLLIAGALVLMILSFLYRATRWFIFAEHVMVGGAVGYGTTVSLRQIYYQGLMPISQGLYWYILAIIGGALFFAKYSRRFSWWVRVPTALLIGTGIGLNMRAGVETQITAQLIDTVKALNAPSLITNINNLIIMIGVCFASLYFFFSMEAKGPLMTVSKLGRYFLMIAFGGSFAYAVLGRTSLLISRCRDLLSYPTYYLIPIAALLILYDILRRKKTP